MKTTDATEFTPSPAQRGVRQGIRGACASLAERHSGAEECAPCKGAGMGVRSIVATARKLRRSSTDVERKRWHRMRDKQIEKFRFRRQRPIEKYIVDFICLEARLIVELDGGQHAESVAHDQKRSTFLHERGYRVLRFWNSEVIENIGRVLERLREALLLTRFNPTCSARCPLHRATVRQAASTLAEIPASPLTLSLAGEGTDLAGAEVAAANEIDRASAEVVAIAPSSAKWGKAGMGVRPPGEGASDSPKEKK